MRMHGMIAATLLAVGVDAGGFPPDVREALRTSKHVYVATKRADGTTSEKAPVWFTADDEAVYFTTAPDSTKVRRIRRGSPLLVWVGRADGPHFEGKAELISDPAVAERLAPAYSKKYWIAWLGLFRPRPDRVRSGKTLIVRVTP
jgi:PPOX class probable F420-dependent enzyme